MIQSQERVGHQLLFLATQAHIYKTEHGHYIYLEEQALSSDLKQYIYIKSRINLIHKVQFYNKFNDKL